MVGVTAQVYHRITHQTVAYVFFGRHLYPTYVT